MLVRRFEVVEAGGEIHERWILPSEVEELIHREAVRDISAVSCRELEPVIIDDLPSDMQDMLDRAAPVEERL